MKISIIDDELAERQKLRDFTTRYIEENNINALIKTFNSGEKFLSNPDALQSDIVFLDVFMNGMNGMEVATKLREVNQRCLIIFVTSSEAFAVESFNVRAFHYLVKPLSYELFMNVFNLIYKSMAQDIKYVRIKESREYHRILVDEIIYIDYFNHYVQIHTNKCVYRTYIKFSEIVAQVTSIPQFLVCYRNIMVNMDHVERLSGREFIMPGDVHLPINRHCLKEIKDQFTNYIFKNADAN